MFDYDKFYKESSVNINSDPQRFSRIASLCRGKVLDIGCCFGVLADYYSGDYTGLDFSASALEKAKKVRRADARFLLRDCSDLTDFSVSEFYADSIAECQCAEYKKAGQGLCPKHEKTPAFPNFDTIILTEFLEHFKNDEKILGPIFKHAKPGSRIIVSCPNGPRIPDPSHERELTIPELRKRFSPYGKVKFYNWPHAYHQILMTCDLGQKNDDLLSLVMCVKDEEKGLERAIFSCIDFVDNIVISVDSKSADKTLEIAKLYADTLKTHIFADDFSKLRNDAHEGVKTKWIFFLDGHEFVTQSPDLEKFLAMDIDGLLVNVKLENSFVFPNPRIYKNGVSFEGKIHEKQICKTTFYYPGFIVEHCRLGVQDPEAISFRQKQCDDMVPRHLTAEIKKNPKNVRAPFHLGLYWESKGEFKKALFYYRKYLKYSKNNQERWFILFYSSMCHLALGHPFRAFHCAFLAELEAPDRWETSKLKGLIFSRKKKWVKAIESLVDSLKDNKGPTLYRPWPRNLSGTWNLVGECFFNLRNFEKAYLAFDRAAELCEDKLPKKFLEKRSRLMREIFQRSFSK